MCALVGYESDYAGGSRMEVGSQSNGVPLACGRDSQPCQPAGGLE